MRKKCLQILCAVIFTLVFTVFSLKINNSIENVNGAEIVIDTGFTYNDTEEKYYIKNLEGFKNFVEYANNPDYGFVSSDTIILQSDIDATNENIVPINEWNATFDGDKYTIKGLSMFCKVNNGVIRKVEFVESKTKYIDPWEVRTLEDAHNNIYYAWYDYVNTSDDHYSWYAVGGVAGINYGMIHLCGVVDSTIRLEMDPNIKIHAEQPWPEYHFACVGGISGINFGEVNACYVYGSTITTYDDETYEHYDKQESGELDISRTLLNVGTNNCAGGIVGYLSDLENVSYFENVSQYETQVGELDLCISAKNKVRSYGFSIAERELLERLQSNSAYQNDKANADENLKPSKGYGGLFGASYHEAWSDYKTGVEIFLGLNHGYPLLPASSTRILRCYSADNVALDNRGQTYYPDDPYFDIGSSIKAQNYLIQPYLHDYNNHENNTIFASYSDQEVSYSPVYGLDPENLIYLQLEPRSSMPHGSYIFKYGFEGRDPDKNFYYNVSLQMIKPTSETDHYGYLYIGRDVDVTIQYYNNQNAYNDKSLSSYAPISYTELNDEKLNSSAGLKNLITFTSNGQTYKLKGLKAKRHPDFTETSWNDYVATFDGENFALTGAYSRENAKTYPYVYPEYEVADITLHIKYNSTNYIGKEDLPTLTIKDNDSSIAELNDKTEKVVSVPLGNGISKTYEIDISSLGNSFDENWYYFSARLTAGKSYSSISYNANINGKSDSDGRGLSKPTFDSLSSLVGGFTFNWNVTVNNNNSSDYNLDLYLTITVYKKIRLNVYEDNNMSSCELQWYTLEGTDGLLWGEDSFYDVRNQNYYVNIANSSLYQYQTVYGTYTPGYFATNNYDESQIYDANYNVVGDEGNLYYNIDLKFDAYSQDSGTYAYPSYNLYGKPQSKTGTYTLTIKPNKMGYVTNAHTPSYTVSYIRFYINGVSYSANSIGVSSIYLFESQDLDNGGVSFEFSSSLVLSLSFPDVTSSDYKLSIVKDGTTIIDNVPIRLNYDSSITDEITSIDFNIDAYYNFGYNSLNYDKYILIYNSASKTLSENNIKPISIYRPDYDSVYEEQVIKTENSTTYTTSSGSTATRYGSGARPTTGSNVVMAKRWTMSNTSETEYVNVAELTKLILNNAVVGSDNTIMYVANGTDVYTQPSIPVGVKSYVYDTSAGTFTIEYPIVFDVCNGQITKFYEHSDSETPYFYYDEAFSYDYPNVTLIAKTYKFYYVQCADTGLTDSNDESMGVSYSDNNDWKIVNTAGTYQGLYEKVSTGSGLGTINRTIDSGLEDRNVYIFVGWTFETSRNATISESTTPLIVATSNTQQVFDNTSFYSQLDSNVDEYFIYEIWKSTTVVSDEVSLTYQVDINKDDNTTQTVNITVGYTFNSAQNLYLPNNSYIDAPGVNGYTFDHWVSISSCDGYVRYLLAGNTASSLQVNNISVSQYYEALNKILTVTAYYTKMPDLPNNMTIDLIINKKVNGKSVGTETKTINYTLVDYYYTPTISSINYPNVSNATFQSWYGYDNDTGAMFKNVFNISNSIINVKSLNSLSLSGYSNEYYVDANYRANDTFMLQFDYYSTDGTYLSTENVNFSTTNFTFDKYGTASRTFSSASNLGFPSLKQFDGRTLRFNKIQEVINSPYKGETSYITYSANSLTIYLYMSSSSTDNENLLDYKNASGLICGQDNNTCIIKVYYEKFIGLELTYIYIDKSNNTVAGSVNNIYASGESFVVNSVPESIGGYTEFSPKIQLVDYPTGKNASNLHYTILPYGQNYVGEGSGGEPIYSYGFTVEVNNNIDDYYNEEIYVYYYDDYNMYEYNITISIVNIDENSNELSKKEIQFDYKSYDGTILGYEYYGSIIENDLIDKYNFTGWTKQGELVYSKYTTELVTISSDNKTANIASASAFADFDGPIYLTLYAHYEKVVADTVTVTVNINKTDINGTITTTAQKYTLHDEEGENSATDWYLNSSVNFELINRYSYINFVSSNANFTMNEDGTTLTIDSNFPTGNVTLDINYQIDATLIVIHYCDVNGNLLNNPVDENKQTVGTNDVEFEFYYKSSSFGADLKDKIATISNYTFLGFNNIQYANYSNDNSTYITFLKESGEGSYKNYITQSSPINAKGYHIIEVNAVFSGKTNLTINYLNDTTSLGSKSYVLHLTTGIKDSQNIYLGNTIEVKNISGYIFKNWSFNGYDSWFETDAEDIKILILKENYPSEIPDEITITAEYLPETIDIIVKNKINNEETYDTTYTYYWNKTRGTNDATDDTIKYVGDKITAENKTGYLFSGWDCNNNADYFDGDTSAYTLTLKNPTSSSNLQDITISPEITIYKVYVDDINSSYDVEIKIVGKKGNDEEIKNTTFKFYYKTSTQHDDGYCLGQIINLVDLVKFGNEYWNKNSKLTSSSNNIGAGVSGSNTKFEDTKITLPTAVSLVENPNITINYSLGSTNVKFNLTTIIKESEDKKIEATENKEFDYSSTDYGGQVLVLKEKTGCVFESVNISQVSGDAQWNALFGESSNGKQVETKSKPYFCSADYEINITITFKANVVKVTFEQEDENATVGNNPIGQKIVYIYYNDYIGEGDSLSIGKIEPETINDYQFLNWNALSDDAKKLFELSADGKTLTMPSLTINDWEGNKSVTITALYEYSAIVTITRNITVDGNIDDTATATFTYYYKKSATDAPNEIGYGKEFVAENVYDTYYSFNNWTVEDGKGNFVTINGKILTLNQLNTTPTDFIINQNYKSYNVTINLAHNYLTDCQYINNERTKEYTVRDDATATLTYHYRLGIIVETSNLYNSNNEFVNNLVNYSNKTYRFFEWKVESNDDGVISLLSIVNNVASLTTTQTDLGKDKEINLNAYYDIDYATINFVDNMGNQILTDTYPNGFEYNYKTDLTQIEFTAPTKDSYEFTHWAIVCGSSNDYLDLFDLTGENNKYTVVKTKDNTQGDCSLIYKITLVANYRSTDTDICTITVEYNYDGVVETKTYIFHYKLTNTKNNTDLYLGDSIVAPTKAGYTFNNWTINSGNQFFANVDGNKVNLTNTAPSVTGEQTAKITANYTINVSTIIVKFIQADKDLSNLTEEPKRYNFHYDVPGTKDSQNIYLGNTIVAPEIAGYQFVNWTVTNDSNDCIVSNIGNTLTITANKQTSTPDEITVTANYNIDNTNCTITVKGFNHPDSTDKNAKETGSVNLIFYYKRGQIQGAEGEYCLGATLDANNLDFGFIKTNGLSFANWVLKDRNTGIDNSKYFANISNNTLTFVSKISGDVNNFVIEAHYTYTGIYQATFKIYKQYFENNATSNEEFVEDKVFNFADTSLGGLEYGDTISGATIFETVFVSWNAPKLENGATDWEKLWKFVDGTKINEIQTCASNPDMLEEEYVIKLVAKLNINKANVTINFVDKRTDSTINDSINYVIYYNGSARLDNEDETTILVAGQYIETKSIDDYRFIGWMSSHSAYGELFTSTIDKLTVKSLANLNTSGIQNVEINAEYWPNEIITINAITRYDGIEQNTNQPEVFEYYYSGENVPTGDGILKVGDTITAEEIAGKSFTWNLNNNSKYFADYTSGYTIKTQSLVGESGSKTITIYKDYISNVLLINYEHYYQTETGSYVKDETKTSNLKFDYSNTKDLVVVNGSNYTTKISSGVYSLNLVTNLNEKTYIYSYTEFNDEEIKTLFFDVDSNNQVIKTKVPADATGGYTITICRYYVINELYLTVQSKVEDQVENMQLTGSPFSLLQDGRYLYNYDSTLTYTFPTNIDTKTETYKFIGWTIEKTVGNDYFENLFKITREATGENKITKIELSSTNTDCKGVYAVTLVAEFERIDNLCKITLTYKDGDTILNLGDTYLTKYDFYYDTSKTADGSTLYLGNKLSAPKINGYTFKEWRILDNKQFFSFVEQEGDTYPYVIVGNLNLVDSQPKLENSELYYTGLQTANIEAVYEKYAVNITVKYLDDASSEEIASSQDYKFYYGLTRTVPDNDLYLGDTIEALVIDNYGFKEWTIELGDSKFIKDKSTNVLQLATECPKDSNNNDYVGYYNLILVAKYTEQARKINIEYLDLNGHDLSKVETTLTKEYKFFYTQKFPLGTNAYLSSVFTAPARKGYSFVEWQVGADDKKYFTNNQEGQSFSDKKLTIVDELDVNDYPTKDISIVARYKEDVCNITIQFVDENDNKIKEQETIKYYYHNTIKTDGIVYDSATLANNKIGIRNIENYNFVEWENSSTLLEIVSKQLYLKKLDDTFAGEYSAVVVAKYKSQSSYYITINVDYVHWENEYYLDSVEKLNGDVPTQFRYYYYTNKLLDNSNEEVSNCVVGSSNANLIELGYTFRNWKNTTGQLVQGIDIANMIRLTDAVSITFIDKTKIASIDLAINNSAENYLTNETVYKTLSITNENLTVDNKNLLNSQDDLAINFVAYYSKNIVIQEQEIQEKTNVQQLNNIPVNYIVDNTNFGGGVEKEFNYKMSADVIFEHKSKLQLASNLIEGELFVSKGASYDYKLDSFTLDVGKIKTDNSVLDINKIASVYNFVNNADYTTYAPSNYTYDGLSKYESTINAGWGAELPTPVQYFNSPNVYTLDNISNEALKVYIQNFVYGESWNGENGTEYNYAFNLYIQWKGNGYTIAIDTKIKGVQNAYYEAVAGSIGTPIYWFENTPVTDNSYLTEMAVKYGQVNGFVITKLEDSTQIFDSNGTELKVGDKINTIYANSHGDFSITPDVTSYTDLTVKFNYHASVNRVGTLASIYDVVAEKTADNIFELKEKYRYNQQLNLSDYLKSQFQDPNPLTVKYNSQYYYLAGWTLKDIGFNPENWSNIDTTIYSNLINYLLGNSSTIEFRRSTINFDGVSQDWFSNKIMSYDGKGFKCVYGDNSSVITLHAVWLPFYNINLYNQASVDGTSETVKGNIFNANTVVLDKQVATDDKVSINFALTLQNQSVAIDYDIRTSYGKTPVTTGYSLAFYTYMLSAYTITDGTYYYTSNNGTNNWNVVTSRFDNFGNKPSNQDAKYTSLNVQEMFNLYIKKNLDSKKLPKMSIDIKPIVVNATINVDVVNKNRGTEITTSSKINLAGFYKLNSLSINNYSIDYLMTNSDKKIKYLYGVDFVNFLDSKGKVMEGFGENVEDDVQIKLNDGKPYLSLTLNAYYSGDLYFLKIQSKDGYIGTPYEDTMLQCSTAINLASFNQYKTLALNGTVTITQNSFVSIPLGFGKVSTINGSNIFFDYTDIYEQCINQVVTDGNNYYLVLGYGENIYNQDKNTLVGKVSRTDGSILEYYLYSDQAIDTISVDKTRDESYSIRFDALNNRYFVLDEQVNVLNYWTFEEETTIYAVWKKKNYHIDLSVGLIDGVIKYSNTAYLVAKVEATKGTEYYIVNYELDSVSKNYTFYMYTMTETQFGKAKYWYGGWDKLRLTKEQTTRIIVDATSVLTIWVYDQSKDTNDVLVGYRLKQVEVKNPNETSTITCPVGDNTTIAYTKVEGETGQNYVTTNGYETVMDFTNVDLDNNANIEFQAVMEYIVYSLTAETNKVAGIVNGRNSGGEFSTEKYVYQELKIGSFVRVTFKPNLGYELTNWTLNNESVSTDYKYFADIDAKFLKQFIYNGKTSYPTNYEDGQNTQNIGTLFANSGLLNFDLKINIYDEDSNLLETYLQKNNANSILRFESIEGVDSQIVNDLQISANKYRVSIVPTTHNGNKCYTINGVDYAILEMNLIGKAKEYIKQSYVFPINNFSDVEFTFNSTMLSDLVSFATGEVIAEENRIINIDLHVATIFEIKAEADDDFENCVLEGDYLNGTRKLMAGDVAIASADSGNTLANSGTSYYAYNGQTILLKLSADKNYYKGGNIYIRDVELPYEVNLEEEIELTVDGNKFVKANFVPTTINYSVEIKYQGEIYTSTTYQTLKDFNDNQMLNQFPTISIVDINDNPRTSNIVFGDILKLKFDDSYFNCLTDDVLKDYSYNIYLNKVRQPLTEDGQYSWTFVGDMSVEIEIVPMSGNVSVFTNIQDAAELIAVDNRGRQLKISNGTVSFDLMPGDNLTIYAKDNNGYNYSGIKKGLNDVVYIVRTDANEAYSGYKELKLISNYDSAQSGKYEIIYNYITIKAKFIYMVGGVEYTSPDNMPGTGYATEKDGYTIIENMSIYKPAKGGENAGFRFVGYSIVAPTINDIIDDGNEQISIKISDYITYLQEVYNNGTREFELPIYINFIKQYTVQVELVGDEFGQTNVRLEFENGALISQITNKQSMPLISPYLDETSHSNQKFALTVRSRDTQNYYLVLKEKGTNNETQIEPGDNYICQFITGTELIYEGKYIFELDKNYLFTLQYMPRQYSSSISKYLISNNHTLQEYRKDLNYALDQLTDTTTPISVDVATNNEALKDRYGTKNTLTITIEEVYDETSKTYYTDYAIEHVKIDGIVQKLMEEIQVNNSGKKTYVYTLIYDVTHDATIDIVFKRVYGVNVKV